MAWSSPVARPSRFRKDIASAPASTARGPRCSNWLDDLDCAFGELARVTRKDGRVVVGIGEPDAMSRLPFTAHGFQLRGVDEVLETMGHGYRMIIKMHLRLGGRGPSCG